MPTLDERLLLYYEKASVYKNLQNHAQYIEQTIASQKEALKILEVILHKEKKDVEELEKLGWQSLFHRVLGNKEQQLEKERQEYLLAFLKYERCEDEITTLEYEHKIVEQKLSQSANAETELQTLMKEKLKELDSFKPENRKSIIEIIENIRNHHYRVNEIQEARRQAQKLRTGVNKLVKALEDIKWGSSKSFFDRIDSDYKNLKNARNIRKLFNYPSNGIHKLKKELGDISSRYDLHYEFILKTFNDFDDYFFDGLISDWIVQEKIDHSLNIITTAGDRLTRIIFMLEQDIEQTHEFIKTEELAKVEIMVRDAT